MVENWKYIKGSDGQYKISDLGRVMSLKYGKERILKPYLSGVKGNEYETVDIRINGKRGNIKVHKLVAIHFLGYTRNGNFVIDHINNNQTDNRVENLQIITQRKNVSKDRKGVSMYTGVSWKKSHNKWYSAIRIEGKEKYLGMYDCEHEAGAAYQKALSQL